MKPIEVCAVIVTHNPDRDLDHRMRITSEQVGRIVIVDNASETSRVSDLARTCKRLGNAETVCLDTNTGVASAQNTGINRAIRLGFPWTLLLDQDSQPAPDMVRRMADVYEGLRERDRVAIIAPNITNPDTGMTARFLRPRGWFLFKRSACHENQIDTATIVIASGALISNEIYHRLGPFRDDYFIDYVDTEFCLRAVSRGYRIIVACRATLEHRIGNESLRKVGPFQLYPRFHPPARWYYIARNRVPTITRYGPRIPHWLVFELLTSGYHLLRMLALEDRRLEKCHAVVLGTLDGLRGKMGPLGPWAASRWH